MNLSDSKKKLVLAGVVCGMPCNTWKSSEHGILYCMFYP